MKSTLDIGDRSGLMIVLGGVECTITSSNSDIVVVEQVLTFWVAVAKAKGTAEITVSNSIGKRLALTLMVGLTAPTNPIDGDSASLTDNTEIRQKMIRLINQLHMANGVSELPVSEALMNAAQACSDQPYTWITQKKNAKPLPPDPPPMVSVTTSRCSSTHMIRPRLRLHWCRRRSA